MNFKSTPCGPAAPSRHGRDVALVALVLSLSAAGTLPSLADTLVPADLQAAIITRLLGYDRALKSRATDAVVIGIVARRSERSSIEAEEGILRAFEALGAQRVQNLPLRLVSHSLENPAAIGGWLAGANVSLLYVTPGLQSDLDAIRKACAEAGIPAVTPVRGFVEQGLAVGVVLKGDRPGILVNLAVAESAGMDLDPKLLKLSEVIR
jgi:hypothetical protein